jgi:membrane protease YdiL (CAAX protease family)
MTNDQNKDVPFHFDPGWSQFGNQLQKPSDPNESRPAGSRPPDPGSRIAAMIAAALAVVLVGIVVILNQFEAPAAKQKAAAATTTQSAAADPQVISSKVLVKFNHLAGGPDSPETRATMVKYADGQATNDLGRLHAAIVASEVGGVAEGQSRLKLLKEKEDLSPELAGDISVVESLLESDNPKIDDDTAREAFITRHGWFGKLALSRGKPDTDLERAALVGGAGYLVGVIVAIGIVFVLAVIASLTSFITAIVMAATGRLKPKFVPPSPGGSVFLETLPVFVAGFLLIKLVLPWLITSSSGQMPPWAFKASLLTQWLLVPLCMWPLVRGMSWTEFRKSIGWHSGAGVFTEIGTGLFSYLACLPVFAFAVLITLILVVRRGSTLGAGENPQVDNPIFDIIMKAGKVELAMFFILATCWAPLVEEAVFRGSLFRHLRSVWGVAIAAIVSGLVFGVMHGYEYIMLLPVISLGICFAFIREWRGSLISSMTAHFIHNAAALTFLFLLLPIIRD